MKKLTLVAAGLAAAAVTLTGCTPPPTAAAVVEGTQIPVSTVREGAPTLVAVLQDSPATAQLRATLALTQGEVSHVIAARHNLTVSGADISRAISASQLFSALADLDGGQPIAEAAAVTQVVLNRLGEDTYLSEVPTVEVEVNPRFGAWNPETGQLVDGSLSAIAPKA